VQYVENESGNEERNIGRFSGGIVYLFSSLPSSLFGVDLRQHAATLLLTLIVAITVKNIENFSWVRCALAKSINACA